MVGLVQKADLVQLTQSAAQSRQRGAFNSTRPTLRVRAQPQIDRRALLREPIYLARFKIEVLPDCGESLQSAARAFGVNAKSPEPEKSSNRGQDLAGGDKG